MTLRSTTVLVASVAVVAIAVAACGGGSEDDATPTGGTGQADVVLDAAPAVVASSATISGEAAATTVAPASDPLTVPAPDVTSAEPTTTSASTTPTTTTANTSTATTTTVSPPDVAATSTDPPGTGPGGVPVGYRSIADDSGILRANVPAEWVEVDGGPDGELRQLSAAADLGVFLAGYTEPGMVLLTGAAATPDSWADGLSTTLGVAENDGCVVIDTSDYTDNVHIGTEHVLRCGSAASVVHLIGGRDADGDLFFLLAIVRSVDDPDVRHHIVQSFSID